MEFNIFLGTALYLIFYANMKGSAYMSGILPCVETELQLKYTLNGGQSFRWKETESNQWTGVFAHKVWTISQDKENLLYKVFSKNGNNVEKVTKNKKSNKKKSSITVSDKEDKTNEDLLIDYFRLNVSLKELYGKWSENDPNFAEAATTFHGIRIMKQDPVENIFSFICSANNHISRISSMVEKLCVFYGEQICDVDGVSYHDFPPVEALAEAGVDLKLRNSGFGYRAKYIHESAKKILNLGGSDWLEKLQKLPYNEAKEELMVLPGIGAKVADCICLMSLGHLESVPVDTHVFQIASQHYLPHLKKVKSVTPKVYNEIGDHFRSLYGPLAGWAHTILFCADLRKFQNSNKRKVDDKKNDNKRVKKCH